MIEGLTLAFAIGLLAVLSPGAIAFALALVGLPVMRPLRASAVMAASFTVIFPLAAVAVSLLDLGWILDVAVWAAAAAGAALAAAGIRIAARAPLPRELPTALYGGVAAVAALPAMLMIYEALIDQGAEAAGPAAAVFLTIVFGAGCAAALALPALAAASLAGAGARARRAAGVLVAAAGGWIVLYWLPALFGGRIERGGAVEGAANGASSALGELAARHSIVFALVLLGMSIAALGAATRTRWAPALSRSTTPSPAGQRRP